MLWQMTWGELSHYRAMLNTLPPVGVVVIGGYLDPKKARWLR